MRLIKKTVCAALIAALLMTYACAQTYTLSDASFSFELGDEWTIETVNPAEFNLEDLYMQEIAAFSNGHECVNLFIADTREIYGEGFSLYNADPERTQIFIDHAAGAFSTDKLKLVYIGTKKVDSVPFVIFEIAGSSIFEDYFFCTCGRGVLLCGEVSTNRYDPTLKYPVLEKTFEVLEGFVSHVTSR